MLGSRPVVTWFRQLRGAKDRCAAPPAFRRSVKISKNARMPRFSICHMFSPLWLDTAPCHKKPLSWLILWDIQYNARSNRNHSNITKYCPSTKKWLSWLIFVTHTRNIQYDARSNAITLQHHQLMRLPRNFEFKIWPQDNPRIVFWPWSDHDPTTIRPWNRHLEPAAKNDWHGWSSPHLNVQ